MSASFSKRKKKLTNFIKVYDFKLYVQNFISVFIVGGSTKFGKITLYV